MTADIPLPFDVTADIRMHLNHIAPQHHMKAVNRHLAELARGAQRPLPKRRGTSPGTNRRRRARATGPRQQPRDIASLRPHTNFSGLTPPATTKPTTQEDNDETADTDEDQLTFEDADRNEEATTSGEKTDPEPHENPEA
ncbi:hypothetical protein [Streptomyces virginiae]|uniref:hypothetical protein n=1 Tax=Streptomyces virginiae TaxID=1961 RepID=UPI0036FEDB88